MPGRHLEETFGSRAVCGQYWPEAGRLAPLPGSYRQREAADGVTGWPRTKMNGSRHCGWLLAKPRKELESYGAEASCENPSVLV